MQHRGWLVPWALGLLVSAGCGSSADPVGPGEPFDPAKDFIPGDPNFKREPRLDVENISQKGSLRSHNAGENCLRCHQANGPGLGQFTLAGTVHDGEGRPLANAELKLYARATQISAGYPPNVELSEEILSIPVDGRGNFFTTQAIKPMPSRAVYPRFLGPNGELLLKGDHSGPAQMGGGVTTGGCNFCHGLSLPIVAIGP